MSSASYAFFRHLLSFARGVDLDDDEALRARILATAADARTAADEELLGVIEARGGRFAESAQALARSRARPVARSEAASSPALASHHWGSSCDDDPYPARFPPQPDHCAKLRSITDRVRLQKPNHPCAAFYRATQFSRAHVGFELHGCHIYIADVHHRANPFPHVVRELNEALQTDCPETLPLDVVAALHGMVYVNIDAVQPRLDSEGGDALVVSACVQRF